MSKKSAVGQTFWRNNVTVEIKCSQMEKELITTDRRELQELLNRAGGQEAG
ncbi:MAG: hypothetical protein HFE97_02675 [Oscillospiraceae bacterium]|nr:hypothetical protein [Oscillospiraceae bacterium]